MYQRIAHADDQVRRGRHVGTETAEIVADAAYAQSAGSLTEFIEQFPAKIDRQDIVARSRHRHLGRSGVPRRPAPG